MTDIDRYRKGANHCAQRASASVNQELHSIWITVERSYRFLLEREERIAREARPTHSQLTADDNANASPSF